ncbi:MAG: hypothetical protein M5U23_03005 [Acidimicrobiia bacterium]|nr:hypothetical protein [Acidimicrobiia bacterium]
MDLVLIEDLSPDLSLVRVRQACLDVFTHRETHPWPPVVAAQSTWLGLWANLVDDTGFYIADLGVAIARVNSLIGEIDQAT